MRVQTQAVEATGGGWEFVFVDDKGKVVARSERAYASKRRAATAGAAAYNRIRKGDWLAAEAISQRRASPW